MRAWRWPARVIIPALVVAGLVVDAGVDRDSTGGETFDVPNVEVVVPAADQLTSTWMCPIVRTRPVLGSVARLDSEIVITNLGEDASRVAIELVSPTAPTDRRALTVDAGETVSVPAELDHEEDLVAALVEAPTGAIAVHRVFGSDSGSDTAPCSTITADRWYVPAADTGRDAVAELVVFNPLPSDAVVDLSFATEAESGAFTAIALEGVVVAARDVVRIDLTEHVRRRDEVAALIDVRAGRVVVDHVQSFDGTEGRTGLSVAPATASTAQRWTFAAGYIDEATEMSVHVFNPTQEVAEIDVGAHATSGAGGDAVALTVGPRDAVVVPVVPFSDTPPTVPSLEIVTGSEFAAVVESANGVPVVAGVEIHHGDGTRDGGAREDRATAGAAAVAARATLVDRALVVVPTGDGLVGRLALHNPGAEAAQVTVRSTDGAASLDVTVPPAAVEIVPVDAGLVLTIDSTRPIGVTLVQEVVGATGVRVVRAVGR